MLTRSRFDFSVGSHVITPDGIGVVAKVETHPVGWARGGATEPTPRVRVGFGSPVTEPSPYPREAAKGETRTYLYAVERTYDAADVALKPSTHALDRETVEEFIARKSSPKWKAPALPKSRRAAKLKPEKLAELMAAQGATGSFGEAA